MCELVLTPIVLTVVVFLGLIRLPFLPCVSIREFAAELVPLFWWWWFLWRSRCVLAPPAPSDPLGV